MKKQWLNSKHTFKQLIILTNIIRNRLFPLGILILFFSCSDENEAIESKLIADFQVVDEIDRLTLRSTTEYTENGTLTYRWLSKADTISILNASGRSAIIMLPDIDKPLQIEVSHTVSDGRFSDSLVQEIELPVMTNLRRWGMGRDLVKEHSNDVDYDWYIDQMNSGQFNYENCGPATVTMALKWHNRGFSKNSQDARNTYRVNGGWWYTDDIINYLNAFSAGNYTIELTDADSLVTEIDKGNIIIICLDMYYINEEERTDWRVGKFYETEAKEWGHFFIIKGYKIIDGKILYEIYDPYSWGVRYTDGSLKGRNRYYSSSDINSATNHWWDYAIIVSQGSPKSSMGIDVSKIDHKFGR